MGAIWHPLADDAIRLHELVIRRTGGAPGLRDRAALESALNRAQTAAYRQDAGVPEQAALLLAGIALSHPFVDGNARTAFLVADVFLRRNRYRIRGDYRQIEDCIVDLVADPERRSEHIAHFIAFIEPAG